MISRSALFKKVKFDLVIYGSFANGLAIKKTSDLDLSLVVDPSKRYNHFDILTHVHRALSKYKEKDIIFTELS